MPQSTRTQYFHVGFVGSLSTAFSREVLAGLFNYANHKTHHPKWRITSYSAQTLQTNARLLSQHVPDALITQCFDPGLAEYYDSLGVPWVNTGAPDAADAPCIITDDFAIGQMGADELFRRGLRNFLFIGNGVSYSTQRYEGFRSVINERGYDCSEYRIDPRFGWAERANELPVIMSKLADHLRSLDTPLGILCQNDEAGFFTINACHEVELHVPEQVAILGVDNDELGCMASYPSLSSVRTPTEAIGQTAAALLSKLAAGDTVPQLTKLAPIEVVTRMSTDISTIEDQIVAKAIEYIKANITGEMSVELVAEHVNLSRRALQKRFQKAVGITIAEEIIRCRVDRAKELLRSTDWPISRVATEAGYANSSRLATTFRRELNETPKSFRERTQDP